MKKWYILTIILLLLVSTVFSAYIYDHEKFNADSTFDHGTPGVRGRNLYFDFAQFGDLLIDGDVNIVDELQVFDINVFGSLTAVATVQAEHLYSTDDLQVDDDGIIDGRVLIGGGTVEDINISTIIVPGEGVYTLADGDSDPGDVWVNGPLGRDGLIATDASSFGEGSVYNYRLNYSTAVQADTIRVWLQNLSDGASDPDVVIALRNPTTGYEVVYDGIVTHSTFVIITDPNGIKLRNSIKIYFKTDGFSHRVAEMQLFAIPQEEVEIGEKTEFVNLNAIVNDVNVLPINVTDDSNNLLIGKDLEVQNDLFVINDVNITGELEVTDVNIFGSLTATATVQAGTLTDGTFTVTGGVISGGTWQADTITVPFGGTGATTLTDGGILLGSGTGAITALGVAANGQIPIGDGTTDPVLATLTEGSLIDIANAAGSITISGDESELDVLYLRLDATNDPMTGELDMGGQNITGTDIDISAGTGSFTGSGTSTFGQIIDSGLTASKVVFTDGSKQLTSTAITSGDGVYWKRTGTVLSPVTSGDDLTTTGQMALASAIDATAMLKINKTSTSIRRGIWSTIVYNGSGAESQGVYCLSLAASTNANHTSLGGDFLGIAFQNKYKNPTGVSTLIGGRFNCQDTTTFGDYLASGGGSHIWHAGHFACKDATGTLWTTNNPTITTFNMFVEDAPTGYGTNHTHWSIYSEGGDSFHSGDLAFGQTDKAERIGSDTDGTLDLYAGTSIDIHSTANITGDVLAVGDIITSAGNMEVTAGTFRVEDGLSTFRIEDADTSGLTDVAHFQHRLESGISSPGFSTGFLFSAGDGPLHGGIDVEVTRMGTFGSDYDTKMNFAVNKGASDILTLFSINGGTDSVTIGRGAAGVDYSLIFDGENDDFKMTWMEDESYLKFDRDIAVDNFKEVRFYDDGGNYVGFKAPALTANQIWTLPATDGSANDIFITDGSGATTFTSRKNMGIVTPITTNYISGTGTAGSDNTAQTVKTIVLPANSLTQVGDRIRIRCYWTGDIGGGITGTNTLNGQTIAATTDGGAATFQVTEAWLHYIDSTHANIISMTGGIIETTISAANVDGFDFTSDQDIDLDQDLVVNNHIIVYFFAADIFPKGV